MEGHPVPPPPPYSETDIYSNSGGVRTPQASHIDTTSVRGNPETEYPPSEGESTIYTPPYTPDGSAYNSGIPTDPEQVCGSPAAAYFASRPVPRDCPDPLLLHTVMLSPASHFDDVPFPEPEDSWIKRDLTHQDWATFVNYLIPQHITTNNNNVADRKMRAEVVDERMQRLTIEDEDDQRTNLSQVDSHLDPLRNAKTPKADIHDVVVEWNQGFFAPRGLHIDLEEIPEDQTRDMPGAWKQDGPDSNTYNQGFVRNNTGLGLGSFIRADKDGLRIGRNGLVADPRGFRIGNFLVADNNGLRVGNMVADNNGLRVGKMVADNNGFRIGGRGFGGRDRGGGGAWGPERGFGGRGGRGFDHHGGREPGRYENDRHDRGREFGRHGNDKHDRDASTDSSDSHSSSSSVESVGSLPDYDHLKENQLWVAKRSISTWLAHPEQPVTRDTVRQMSDEIKSAKNLPIASPTIPIDKKLLKREVKELMKQFKALTKTQKAHARAYRRERQRERKAARKERRAAKREAREARKSRRRAEKGKGREWPEMYPSAPPVPPVPGAYPHTYNMPPNPPIPPNLPFPPSPHQTQTGLRQVDDPEIDQFQTLSVEANRIETEAQAERARAGNFDSGAENMGDKERLRALDEAERLETEARRLRAEAENLGQQERGTHHQGGNYREQGEAYRQYGERVGQEQAANWGAFGRNAGNMGRERGNSWKDFGLGVARDARSNSGRGGSGRGSWADFGNSWKNFGLQVAADANRGAQNGPRGGSSQGGQYRDNSGQDSGVTEKK